MLAFNPLNETMIICAIWAVIAVLLVAGDAVPEGSIRQPQSQPVDGPSCDSKSISSVLPVWQIDSFKRKSFSGCTIRSGELAIITNRMNVGLDVTCGRYARQPESQKQTTVAPERPARETLKATNLKPDHSFVMNVYVDIENMFAPRWDCLVKRSDHSYEDQLLFNAFAGYKKRESFHYEVNPSGLYERDLRLTERWRLPRISASPT